MKKPSHFKALISYYATENGGIVNPVSTGFRASFHFPFELTAYTGIQTFEGEDLIFPNDSATVDVFLINAQTFLNKIYTGMDFEISDNSGNIGNGIVSEIYPR